MVPSVPQRAQPRDAYTGEPLRADLPRARMRVPDEDGHIVPPGYLQSSPDLIPVPLVLHKSSRAGGTEGVGLAFSPQMSRYLGSGESPQMKAAIVRQDRAWWRSPYSVRLVADRLAEWYSADEAASIHTAVMAFHRERLGADDAAERCNQSRTWMLQQLEDCDRLSRSHRRTCECPHCQASTWKPGYRLGVSFE